MCKFIPITQITSKSKTSGWDFVRWGFVRLGFCPLGFCPLGFCPLGFCPLGFCPRTDFEGRGGLTYLATPHLTMTTTTTQQPVLLHHTVARIKTT